MFWYFRILRNLSFKGRASCSEYCWFLLFQVTIVVSLYSLSDPFGMKVLHHHPTDKYLLVDIYNFLTVVQTTALQVRRFHDRNMSGWWVLLAIIPFAAAVALAWMLLSRAWWGRTNTAPIRYLILRP
jgi:uncharacterized membrane protein YhaH (DUF805 family)